jgi:clan AA aspartic protease (TIGR02281 family)
VKVAFLFVTLWVLFVSNVYAEMYKWVDEKGTVHFTDDLSKIPEQYRPGAEIRKPLQEIPAPPSQPKPPSAPTLKPSEPEGIVVKLIRRHETLLTEVVLNRQVKELFIVDTGASFTLISRQMAKELGIKTDETTPFIRSAGVSEVISTPLVTLNSVRVGKAEVENVETVIYNMPSEGGLLGNSFLNKFRVMIDAVEEKLVLYPMQGVASPDRPGGYPKDYWVGQFRFYLRNLEGLRRLKEKVEKQGAPGELLRINNAIRYFESKLSELERKASFANVPRNWRE